MCRNSWCTLYLAGKMPKQFQNYLNLCDPQGPVGNGVTSTANGHSATNSTGPNYSQSDSPKVNGMSQSHEFCFTMNMLMVDFLVSSLTSGSVFSLVPVIQPASHSYSTVFQAITARQKLD